MKTTALTIIVTGVCLFINSAPLFGQHAIKVKNFPDSLPNIKLK